jgi:hypothetical protein
MRPDDGVSPNHPSPGGAAEIVTGEQVGWLMEM